MSDRYLATDAPDVLRAALRDYGDRYTWFYLHGNPQRKGLATRIEKQLKRGGLDGFLEGANFLIDVLLLAETDVFVGKFTSNLDRLVHALQVGRDGCVRPFASLDAPWCFDFGGMAGRVRRAGEEEVRFKC